MHDYYSIGPARLGEGAKIPIRILGEPDEVCRAVAEDMAAPIERNNREGRRTVYICPVGPTGPYPFFVKLVNERRISLKNTWFINMDEYLDEHDRWVDISHRLSFRGFMDRVVYGKIDPGLLMPPEQRIFPSPDNPGGIAKLIDQLGGVDIAFGGIGINGHIAFNEPQDITPEEFLRLPTRALDILPETRAINSTGDLGGAMEDMPYRCVTVGMKEIFAARSIRLATLRDWHRAPVRRAAYGEESAAFPVTLLQRHPDAMITISRQVAQAAY